MAIFDAAALEKTVKAIMPADARPFEKVLVGTLDDHGLQVIAAFKFQPKANGFSWELQGAARYDWSGDHSIAGKVLLRWP